MPGASGGKSRIPNLFRWVPVAWLLFVIFIAWFLYVAWYMLVAEGEVYAMFVIPYVVEAYVDGNNGDWPDSWESLKSGPQPVVFVQHASIDYEIVQRKFTIDFGADPSDLARQTPATFTAIRPIKPVYDYSHDQRIAQLIQTLKKYHPDPRDRKPMGTPNPVSPFPELSDVRGLQATISLDLPPERSVPWFSVPRDRWQAIFAAMLPAEVDPDPVPWEIVGWLEIQTKDENLKVMFSAQGGVLFRIGEEYYRGGNGAALESVIRKAYADSRE